MNATELAQINADIATELGIEDDQDFDYEYTMAQLEADAEADCDCQIEETSDSSSDSDSSDSNSDDTEEGAQVGVEEENENVMDFAQIAAEKEEALDYFSDYLAQIGIEDSETFMAQLSAEISEDKLHQMIIDPEILMGLA